jgi:hypothetical protein
MQIAKKLFPAALATGAGLLLGGCLTQDPALESDSSALATSAYIEPGTEAYNWNMIYGGNPAKDVGCTRREDHGVWTTGGAATNLSYPLWYWLGPNSNTLVKQGPDQNGEIRGVQIDVGPDKKPWVVDGFQSIYQFDGTVWIYRGNGRDIGVGADGSVWRISDQVAGSGGDFAISKWNPATSSWNVPVSGGGVRIDVDASGNPWVVNNIGQIWRKPPSSNTFTQVPGLTGVDIGIGANGLVFVLSTEAYNGGADKKLYRLIDTNGGWKLTNGGGSRVCSDNTGKPWLVTANGNVWATN